MAARKVEDEVKALAVFRHDDALRDRVLQASAHSTALSKLAREIVARASDT